MKLVIVMIYLIIAMPLFLFEEWNNINSIDDSTFDEFKNYLKV